MCLSLVCPSSVSLLCLSIFLIVLFFVLILWFSSIDCPYSSPLVQSVFAYCLSVSSRVLLDDYPYSFVSASFVHISLCLSICAYVHIFLCVHHVVFFKCLSIFFAFVPTIFLFSLVFVIFFGVCPLIVHIPLCLYASVFGIISPSPVQRMQECKHCKKNHLHNA